VSAENETIARPPERAANEGWLAHRLRWALAEPAPERYRQQIRADLLDETLKLANTAAVTHLAIAIAIAVLFWDSASRSYLFGFSATVATMTGIIFYINRLYRRGHIQGPSKAGVAFGYRIAAAIAVTLGAAWGTVPMMLFAPADENQRLLIIATVTGLISDAYVFRPLLAVSILFMGPLIVGSFVGLARSGEALTVSIGLVLLVYTVFILANVLRMSRLSRERILDRLRVEDQSQTIGLLLNEFEASTSDWLWETDASGRLQHVSAPMAQALDRPEADLHATSLATLLGGTKYEEGDGTPEILACLDAHEPFRERLAAVTGPGGLRWLRLSGKPFQDRRGSFAGFRGVGSDVTASRAAEERIAYLASCDTLTGLSNRAVFHEVAEAACREAMAPNGPVASLLYLDLDGFKLVNDSAGHGAGDALLRQVADRLRAVTRAVTDRSAQGFRLGGDEFAILHRGRGETAEALAQTCVCALGEPYWIDGVRAEIGVSVGLAHAPIDATDPESLLRKADLALYTAKETGKGRWHAFDASLERRAHRHRELGVAMRAALTNGEMALHYQPLVSLTDDGTVVGFEALLRWTRPGEGPISPAELIPIAESTGFVIEIGCWALRTACAEAATWPDGLRVAVNISSIHFRLPGFVDEVEEALGAAGLPAHRLEVEITETIFLGSTPTVIDNLNRLRGLGVRIALDDFGTGFSSLSYLTQFPVDKIKIDRAFVRDLISRRECLTVIEAIMVIARDLAIDVTVEGVETVQQADLLRLKHCNSAQGFLYSPARPAGEIPHLIEDIPHRSRAMVQRASAA
jgi:diguanylate cyclase (GGDEF)-like protein